MSCALVLATVFALLAQTACRAKPPQPVEAIATPDAAASGIVSAVVAAFQRQSGVKIDLRIAPQPDILRAASARAVQIVFVSETDAPAYVPMARLSGRFASEDFALFGPRHDPARVHTAPTAIEAFRRIAKRKSSRFCSATEAARSSEREKELWAAAGIDPHALRHYSECPGDDAAVLREAEQKNAYTLLEDQAAGAASTKMDMKPLLRAVPGLHDDYAVILVDHEPRIRRDKDAEWFVQWLMSYQGRDVVQNYSSQGTRK